MNVRITIAVLVALAAALLGYVVGKPSQRVVEEVAPAENRRPDHQRPTRDLNQITEPRSLESLDEELSAIIEKGLATAAGGDPMAALLALLEIEDDVLRAEAALELVGRLDGSQLRAVITGMLSGENKDGATILEEMFDEAFVPIAMFDRWALLDPDGVEELALSPMKLEGMGEMALIMRVLPVAFLARTDTDRAFAIAEQMRNRPEMKTMESKMGGSIIDMLIGVGIGLSDPAEALRTMREKGLSAEGVVDADPILDMSGAQGASVLAELLQFPESEARDDMLIGLYDSWGEYDPEAALASLEQFPEEDLKDEWLFFILEAASRSDPQGSIKYLHNLPEGSPRNNLAQNIASNWVQEQPVTAMEWAKENMDEGEFTKQLTNAAETPAHRRRDPLCRGTLREVP